LIDGETGYSVSSLADGWSTLSAEKVQRKQKQAKKGEKQRHIRRWSSIADVFGVGKIVVWPGSRWK